MALGDISSRTVEPYSVLAQIYDEVMSHVDYDRWFNFAAGIIADHGLKLDIMSGFRPLVLECACGTGRMAKMFAMHGFRVDAFDRSREMIEIAQTGKKLEENNPHFYVTDFLNINPEQEYDGALCLYDSINYLLNPNDVVKFLKIINNCLKPDAPFLFDICTELNSKTFFSDRLEIDVIKNFQVERRMRYIKRNQIQENEFTIFHLTDHNTKVVEVHRQKIYSVAKIRELISKAGLTIVEEVDEYSRKPASSRSLRVHFLCKRK